MKKSNKKRSNNKNDNFKVLILINCIQTFLILILAIHVWSMGSNTTQVKKPNTKETNNKIDLKDENYVLLGDSITDWYPTSDFFDDGTPIINSGFAGYTTKDLLKNLDETVYQYNPTKVFIQIGTNDLNCDDSNSEIAYNNIVKIIKDIKKNRPYTKIYLESIYPVNQDCDKTNKGATGKRENSEIAELNDKLKTYCKKNNVEYIDMYSVLSDDNGDLKTEYTNDGLHLNLDGYSKVSDEIKKCIKEN